MANKKLIGLDSLAKFAQDFSNEIDKKFNAELEIKADKSELFSKDYNDLTNKPCYETSELKLFTNDGDNTGRLIVNNGTTNIKFAKISEDEIDSSSIDQARFSMFVGDEGYEISDPSTFAIVENETGSAINLGEYVVCTFNDNFAMDMSGTIVTFPEKGLYFSFNASGSHAWRLDNVYLPIASVKQLDEKFIPDTIARTDDIPEGFSGDYSDLTNKPEIPSIKGLASETYVNEAIAGIVDSAPETLDTLNELAQALGDDPNFATTIATEIGTKASTEFVNNMLSGLRLVQMTQSEYDALEVKDSNTLYIII